MWSKMLLLSLYVFISLAVVATSSETSNVFLNNETETINRIQNVQFYTTETNKEKKIPGSYEGTISNKTSNIVFSNDKTETLNKAIKQSPKLNLPVTKEKTNPGSYEATTSNVFFSKAETSNETIKQPPKLNLPVTKEKKNPDSYEATTSNKTSNVFFSNAETETSNVTIKQPPKLNLPVTKEKQNPGSYEATTGNKTNVFFSNNKTETSNKTINEPPKLSLPTTREKIIFGLYEATLNIDKSLNNLNFHGSNQSPVNIVVSPLSLIAAMTLILLGAGGETKAEVGKLFGFDENILKEVDSVNVYKELGLLLKYFQDNSGETLGSQVNLAKAIFVQNGYNISNNFKTVAKDVLNSELVKVDFNMQGPQAQKTINKWISTQTHGKISDIMQDVPLPDTKTIITSALYFTGEWENPFFINYTRIKPFYYGSILEDRKMFKQHNDLLYVSMMVGTSEVLYHKNDELHFKAIGLPYKENKFVTYFVLPNSNYSLRDLVGKMDKFSLRQITNNTKVTEFTYFVPKMKLESFTNFRPVLQNVGIKKMFDPKMANFTNMVSDPNVYINDILHKVEVDINEIGTTASAATAVTVTRGGQATFNVNKPFMFFIHHVESDTIIFWGTVYKPTPHSTIPPPPPPTTTTTTTTTEQSDTAN